jgi:tRNA pseudouridine38-40 synthase
VPRYRLLVAYDGTGFCGWQKQEPPVRPEGGGPSPYSEVTPMLHAEGEAGGREGRVALRTVQGVLERAVREVVREPVEVIGASRTDSGVHAEGQVAAFTCEPREVEQTEAGAGPVVMRGVGWPVERGADRLAAAINSRLPEDVLVRAASVAARDFDPVGDVVAKGYSYTLHVGLERPLFDRALVHHVFWRNGLNLGAMAEAAAMMEGEHDFAGFAAAGHGRLSTVRRVLSCRVVAISPERVRLDVAGTGFLWNMVRIMSGTLLEVGTGRRTLEQVAAALKTGDRRQAGATLPPTGLCLRWIEYRGEGPGGVGGVGGMGGVRGGCSGVGGVWGGGVVGGGGGARNGRPDGGCLLYDLGLCDSLGKEYRWARAKFGGGGA